MRDLHGVNATNRAGRIYIDPDTPDRAAIVAQELWEARFKANPADAVLVRVDNSERRKMEITSHEIEVQAAAVIYGRVEAVRRMQEAASMHRGYGGLFKDMPRAKIEAAMLKRRGYARRWVERNRAEIEKWRGPE